jgi:error-prone DNA polymerase
MYAELHTRSAFSFLEGASLPKDLVQQAANLGLPAIALVDTAMTANVITYRSRSAVRDVGKALAFDAESLARLSALSARGAWGRRDNSDGLDLESAGLDLENERVGKLLKLSREIVDLPRHLGQHSGGMAICQGQLDSIVPLEPATMPNRVIVQWDKEDCTDLGLIKVDLSVLGMMAVLKDSMNLIRDHYNEAVDLAHLPPDDPTVDCAL